MRAPHRLVSVAFVTLLLALGCGSGDGGLGGPVTLDLSGPPPRQLSELRLLAWDGERFRYNDRVVPYDLNTPLFTDYALKARAIYLPEGTAAAYDADEVLALPVGTVLIKSFAFPEDLRAPEDDLRLIETRLLIHTPDGWQAWPYVWEADGSDATLAPSGDVRAISFVGRDGETHTSNYLVPQRNQCQSCHEIKDEAGETHITPIGPKARHLNREEDFGGDVGVRNQLELLAERGMLMGLPALAEVPRATDFRPLELDGHADLDPAALDAAARDYLDINCAHCHNPRGVQGITSQLFLSRAETDLFHLGVCKRPGSAGTGTGGLEFDIVPGDPDQSILVFRTETEEVGAMMPLLGRSLQHAAGASLLRDWIAAMEPVDCGTAGP